MKIALVDDEGAVRETVKTILLHYRSDLEIRQASGVEHGIQLITDFHPDLVFLDIEMGDGTGFDMLTRLHVPSFSLVFVTAHDHYAIKAFKFSALDYILKPVDPQEIMKALVKAETEIADHKMKKIQTLMHNGAGKGVEKIALSDSANIHLIDLADIIVCQAVGNYTQFFLANNREIVISKTLKHYDELLSDQNFFRVHQSYLINLVHLSRFDKREGGEVVMKDGRVVPVAVRKRESLLELLKEFRG